MYILGHLFLCIWLLPFQPARYWHHLTGSSWTGRISLSSFKSFSYDVLYDIIVWLTVFWAPFLSLCSLVSFSCSTVHYYSSYEFLYITCYTYSSFICIYLFIYLVNCRRLFCWPNYNLELNFFTTHLGKEIIATQAFSTTALPSLQPSHIIPLKAAPAS